MTIHIELKEGTMTEQTGTTARPRTLRRALPVAFVLAVGSMAFTCQGPPRVKPPQSDNTPAVIEVALFDIAGTATITPTSVSSSGGANQVVTVKAAPGKCVVPQLFVTAKATDDQGVRSVTLKITPASSSTALYEATVTQDPDGSGTVSTGLSVLGKNGASGDTFTLTFGNKAGCPQPLKFHVHAEAYNFNPTKSEVDFDIVPDSISSAGCICE